MDWRTGVATVSKTAFAAKSIDIDAYEFADKWRAKYQPAMERVRSGNRGYFPLDILHRENLNELLDEYAISAQFTEIEKQKLNRAWEQLPPWADCASGLTAIRKMAIIAPCSNGSIALMARLAKFANLPWDCILGAEIAKNYKPHPDAYLKSIAALDLQPDEVVMVAAHNSDLEAAQALGIQTAFIARPTEYGENQTIDLAPSGEWNYVIDEIGDLARIYL